MKGGTLIEWTVIQLTIDSYYAAWPHNPFLSEKDVLQGRRSVLS